MVDIPALTASLVDVQTSVPVFIGYTEKALKGFFKPWRISSMAEFQDCFGLAPTLRIAVDTEHVPDDSRQIRIPTPAIDFYASLMEWHTLYHHMLLYFSNGGETCYVVSVGSYDCAISKDDLIKGLNVTDKEIETTLVVVPEAVNLSRQDCAEIQKAVLVQCATLKNRFAILDVPMGFTDLGDPLLDDVKTFRDNLCVNDLSYGAAYYPWLETDVMTSISVETICWVKDIPDMQTANLVLSALKKHLNLIPPSAVVAGLYCRIDKTRGIWMAPANVELYQVRTIQRISDVQLEDMTTPIDGKAINAIRQFEGFGLGALVWGARTLDGNSLDWRYINHRRTSLFLEQTIKEAAKNLIFEPNVADTWVALKGMIQLFLTNFWEKGGLAGNSPDEAYSVHLGLGETMTPEDILMGILRVTVLVALSRPGEFVEMTFEQDMQRS